MAARAWPGRPTSHGSYSRQCHSLHIRFAKSNKGMKADWFGGRVAEPACWGRGGDWELGGVGPCAGTSTTLVTVKVIKIAR